MLNPSFTPHHTIHNNVRKIDRSNHTHPPFDTHRHSFQSASEPTYSLLSGAPESKEKGARVCRKKYSPCLDPGNSDLSTSEPKYTISQIITKGVITTGLWIGHQKSRNLYFDQSIRGHEEETALFFCWYAGGHARKYQDFLLRWIAVINNLAHLTSQLQDPAPLIRQYSSVHRPQLNCFIAY